MVTDPISDMLARIRNAAIARHERLDLPHSSIKENVARVMKEEGYLGDVRVDEGDTVSGGKGRKTLTIIMRYTRGKESAIDGVSRISTPGRRVYVRHDHIPRVRSGLGISILSTSRGVMTDKEARKQKVGGELLCSIW
jgi:small subunit ribosomal protein S8